ncbi:MAG: plasmid replication initiator RepA [Anaerolineaceae bacterium]|nr:plasmid replication initiator RepA [Anaerolineaceae bacterium]
MTKPIDPLLPDRHPNQDFFICDIMDAVPKDDMASMAHPVFSLSTKPDTRIRQYEHNGNSIQITPSVMGLATIHDKDILIYCISQLVAKLNQGADLSRTLRLCAYDLLVATNRQTTGRGYQLLKDAFERLRGTSITTNVLTNGERRMSGFGLIDDWDIRIKDPKTERMVEIEITLSKWMYNSVIGKEVLTLSRDYFRLRKPLERRVYEIARKHCGQQKQWAISLDTLQKKCGSKGEIREFRRMIRKLVQHDHLPDYRVSIAGDKVTFHKRIERESSDTNQQFGILEPETYRLASVLLPEADIKAVEMDWRHWIANGGVKAPDDPDKAFLGFCKKKNPNYYSD